MAVLAFPWSNPALKGVGVGAKPVSLYPVPIVYRTGYPGLPNTRSVRSLCMTLPLPSAHGVAVEQLSALSTAPKALCSRMVTYYIHHQKDINALQWGTRGWGGGLGGYVPQNQNLKIKIVDTVILNVALDLSFGRNQPVKSAGDWYIRILRNKFTKFRTSHIN